MSPMLGKSSLSPVDEEFVLCKVCLEHFDAFHRQPKQLPCSHIYCHRCIDNFLAKCKTNQKQKVTCPICNQSWMLKGSKELRDCQHSIDLVNSFKHLLTRRNLKSKNCRDIQESDMEAFGVEKRKRTVVKTSNPLLHPSITWSRINWSDDDDNTDAMETVTSGESSAKDLKEDSNSLLEDAPRSLKQLWTADDCFKSTETDSKVIDPDVPQTELDHFNEGNKNLVSEYKINPLRDHSTAIDGSTLRSREAKDSKSTFGGGVSGPNHLNFDSVSRCLDESDDLDWNYFTQNLDSPKSTLSAALAKLTFRSNDTNVQGQPSMAPPFDDVFSKEVILSPALIRSHPSMDLVAIVNRSGETEGGIQVFGLDGTKKGSIKIHEEINDVCLAKSRDGKLVALVATSEGVKIFDAANGINRKSIPVGSARFVTSLQRGFVVALEDSLSLCPDLNCDVVLRSLTSIRQTDHLVANGDIFKNIIDMDTCNDLIGLLLSDRCLLLDQQGNAVHEIKLIKTGNPPDLQLSFGASGRKMAVVRRRDQLIEIHDVLPFSGSEASSILTLDHLHPAPDGTITGGTLTKEGELVAIARGSNGHHVYKYNLF